jgi:GMP synthase PP-ATPase subunit
VGTVGVIDDGRAYQYVVGLRAVTSTDGMTLTFIMPSRAYQEAYRDRGAMDATAATDERG